MSPARPTLIRYARPRIAALAADRPLVIDHLLLVFAVLGIVWSCSMYSSGVTSLSLLYYYYQNSGIQVLNLMALFLDVMIVVSVLSWRRTGGSETGYRSLLVTLAGSAALVSWLELWYGSTFSYGTCRDQQILPYGVNNMGVLGSFIFLSYILWRLPLPRMKGQIEIQLRAGALLVLWLTHALAIAVVAEPWRLLPTG